MQRYAKELYYESFDADMLGKMNSLELIQLISDLDIKLKNLPIYGKGHQWGVCHNIYFSCYTALIFKSFCAELTIGKINQKLWDPCSTVVDIA